MAQSLPEVYLCKGGIDKEEWDDRALIEAYDRAMGTIKDKLTSKKKPTGKPIYNISKKNKKSKSKWKVGDYCQAVYSKDNLLYEAEILEINEIGGKCIVQYTGYENEEEVDLDSIYQSQGKTVRAQQIEAAKCTAEQQQWELGDLCLALFSEDGAYYQAEIVELYPDSCLVKFVGYGNEDEVDLENVLPLSAEVGSLSGDSPCCASNSRNKSRCSLDESSSTFSSDQSSVSAQESSGGASHSRSTPREAHRHRGASRHRHHNLTFPSHSSVPDFLFPTSSMPLPVNIEMHDELGPMLMAWYMAGFHTGYYQGRSSRLLPGSCMPQSAPNMCQPH